MSRHRLLIFIVTFNAERTATAVISRIPKSVFEDSRYQTEILIIDDSSSDSTFSCGIDLKQRFNLCPLTVLKNPVNLGYGGNQKLGYRYAIDNNFSIVALLHGDGQYAPEELPKLIEPFLEPQDANLNNKRVGAVFGSRMMKGLDAIKGGMPKHKFIGNKILTFLQNKMVNLRLSEWHSGYRLYSCELLKQIPFELNSDGFEFDTDIIIQIKALGSKILELAIPTFYGQEISHVNVLPYGINILFACLQYRLQNWSLLYDPKFDLEEKNNQYQSKFSFESSHSIPLDLVTADDSCLIVGCGPAELVEPFANKANKVALIDLFIGEDLRALSTSTWEANLDEINFDETTKDQNYTKILALDIIEHLRSPDNFCMQIRESQSCQNAEIIITTANIAFLPIRLMLLLGLFNYGKRGILDRTHTRFFTRFSLTRILRQSGFEILELRGIPAPFPLALGDTKLASLLLKMNSLLCKVLPGLFSYQLFVRARVRPTVQKLLSDAKQHAKEEISRIINNC